MPDEHSMLVLNEHTTAAWTLVSSPGCNPDPSQLGARLLLSRKVSIAPGHVLVILLQTGYH